LLSFFGCGLTAFGPGLSIYLTVVVGNAQYVILSLSSAFFWVTSLLIISILWYFINPYTSATVTIIYGVLIQEFSRWLYFLLYKKAEYGLNTVAAEPGSKLNQPMFAFVSGLGFGLTSALITYVTLLESTLGPGTLFSRSCPSTPLPFISAISTALMSLLHIFWMLIAFEGYNSTNPVSKWSRVLLVLFTHLGSSFATLMNDSSTANGCVYSNVVLALVLLTMIAICLSTFNRKYKY